jgi:hypothetical protein
MLEINDIKTMTFEAEVDSETEWQKVAKAMDNIKLGDLSRAFSLPMEINEMLEKIPRRIFVSKPLAYEIYISPKMIAFRLKDATSTEIGLDKKVASSPTVADSIYEGEANFKLFLGAYLGAMDKAVDKLKVNITMTFSKPIGTRPISQLKAPIVEEINSNFSTNFKLGSIGLVEETISGQSRCKITEDLNTQSIEMYLDRSSISSPTSIAVGFTKTLEDLIKQGNDILTSLGAN